MYLSIKALVLTQQAWPHDSKTNFHLLCDTCLYIFGYNSVFSKRPRILTYLSGYSKLIRYNFLSPQSLLSLEGDDSLIADLDGITCHSVSKQCQATKEIKPVNPQSLGTPLVRIVVYSQTRRLFGDVKKDSREGESYFFEISSRSLRSEDRDLKYK